MKLATAVSTLALVALTGCRGGGDGVSRATTSTAGSSVSSGRTSTTASTPVQPATSIQASTTASAPACLSGREIDRWPVDQRAAQLIVLPSLDFDVAALTPSIRAGAGGVLFLGGGSAPSDLHEQLAAIVDSGAPGAAPLVMADVEGGGVQRLKGAVDPFAWARDLAATQTVDQVNQLAETVGREMVAAGVDVDLAPVLDLDDRPGPSPTNPDGRRSFSLGPTTASAYGIAFVRGLSNVGVLPVVKHFPGIGGSTHNTDYSPAATRPYSELQTGGLKPFIDAIAAGAPAVMISNAYTPGLTTKPASVSPAVIQDLLRRQLGFSGLVVTDSLSAGAISQAGYNVPQAALASIEAGADLVLFGSTLTPADTQLLRPANVETTRRAILGALVTAVQAGTLPPARLDEAVAHVLTAKGVVICKT